MLSHQPALLVKCCMMLILCIRGWFKFALSPWVFFITSTSLTVELFFLPQPVVLNQQLIYGSSTRRQVTWPEQFVTPMTTDGLPHQVFQKMLSCWDGWRAFLMPRTKGIGVRQPSTNHEFYRSPLLTQVLAFVTQTPNPILCWLELFFPVTGSREVCWWTLHFAGSMPTCVG